MPCYKTPDATCSCISWEAFTCRLRTADLCFLVCRSLLPCEREGILALSFAVDPVLPRAGSPSLIADQINTCQKEAQLRVRRQPCDFRCTPNR